MEEKLEKGTKVIIVEDTSNGFEVGTLGVIVNVGDYDNQVESYVYGVAGKYENNAMILYHYREDLKVIKENKNEK